MRRWQKRAVAAIMRRRGRRGGVIAVIGDWLLATGLWNDSGVWDDSDVWNDT